MQDRLVKPSWMKEGLCYEDKELQKLFFSNLKRHVLQVKMICRGCPVRATCEEYGMDEPYGTWGGITEDERIALKERSVFVDSSESGMECATAEEYAAASAT